MTDEREREIEAREEAATKGPWCWSPTRYGLYVSGNPYGHLGTLSSRDAASDPLPVEANGQFIAHAREDIPYLLAQLREAKAEAAPLLMLESLIGRWHLERFGYPHDSYPAAALELLAALDALKGVE